MDPSNPTTPELHELIEIFFDRQADLGAFEEIVAEELPTNYRRLLAHDEHMTETIEAYHGCPCELEVVAEKIDSQHYSRKILLRNSTDQRVVQYGIVRLDLSVLEQSVQDEIRSKSRPLGRILIENDVLRKVRLVATWEVVPGTDLNKHMTNGELQKCYGRTALIYCNGSPAIELLEIVVE